MWPYWHLKKVGMDVSAPRRGEVIVYKLETSKSIVSKYALYLEEQYDRKLLSYIRTYKSHTDAGDFNFDIRKKRP